MSFAPEHRAGTIKGIVFVAIFSAVATLVSMLPAMKALKLSPLVIGIVLGIVYANTLRSRLPAAWEPGIIFSAKKVLRFAIVFYGFRITFQEIMAVGLAGFLVSVTMVITTFLIGTWVGTKIFKLDRDTSMLTAAGASVCGAAAVLAAEPVVNAESHKTAIAVSMVVLFGTISMFLHPALYTSGILHMTPQEFGIFVGGTVHEVAQVVAVGAIDQVNVGNAAVIVKMTRVILIAPGLIVLGLFLSLSARKKGGGAGKVKLVIPWFAVYFVGMAGLNSLGLLPKAVVGYINTVDTFLLTMAMTALGIETRFSKFKGLGLAPLYAALVMFVWLVVGGYFIVKGVVAAVG